MIDSSSVFMAPARRLRVSNIPFDCQKRELDHVFRRYCCVDLGFVGTQEKAHDKKPKTKVAIVTFERHENASTALQQLQGYVVDKKPLQLAFALPQVNFFFYF